MGIKLITETGKWSAWHAKRNPITKEPISLKRIGLDSKAEALRTERELIVKVEDRIRAKIVPSWEKLVEMWAEDARNRGLTPKTIENYLYSLKAYTFEKWSQRTVDRILMAEIRDLINIDLAAKSDIQKQSVLKFIRCVFDHGVASGHLNRNPCPPMTFKAPYKAKLALTRQQVDRLLTQAKQMDCEWYYHWCMAVYTGMRNGELFSLTWNKVDFEKNRILVNCSWSAKNGLKSTKSGDDRMVPIAPRLKPILMELKLKSSAETDHVLPRISKWNKGDQARELRFFLGGLGLPPVKFHDLRATWATLLLRCKVPHIQVMAAGGWKSLKTMQIYVRNAGVDLDGMMDNFELHDHSQVNGKILELFSDQKVIGGEPK